MNSPFPLRHGTAGTGAWRRPIRSAGACVEAAGASATISGGRVTGYTLVSPPHGSVAGASTERLAPPTETRAVSTAPPGYTPMDPPGYAPSDVPGYTRGDRPDRGPGDSLLDALLESAAHRLPEDARSVQGIRTRLADALRDSAEHQRNLHTEGLRFLAERLAGRLHAPGSPAWRQAVSRYSGTRTEVDWHRISADLRTPGAWDDAAGNIGPALAGRVFDLRIHIQQGDTLLAPVGAPDGYPIVLTRNGARWRALDAPDDERPDGEVPEGDRDLNALRGHIGRAGPRGLSRAAMTRHFPHLDERRIDALLADLGPGYEGTGPSSPAIVGRLLGAFGVRRPASRPRSYRAIPVTPTGRPPASPRYGPPPARPALIMEEPYHRRPGDSLMYALLEAAGDRLPAEALSVQGIRDRLADTLRDDAPVRNRLWHQALRSIAEDHVDRENPGLDGPARNRAISQYVGANQVPWGRIITDLRTPGSSDDAAGTIAPALAGWVFDLRITVQQDGAPSYVAGNPGGFPVTLHRDGARWAAPPSRPSAVPQVQQAAARRRGVELTEQPYRLLGAVVATATGLGLTREDAEEIVRENRHSPTDLRAVAGDLDLEIVVIGRAGSTTQTYGDGRRRVIIATTGTGHYLASRPLRESPPAHDAPARTAAGKEADGQHLETDAHGFTWRSSTHSSAAPDGLRRCVEVSRAWA
ncbi:hypothetical protein [Actinomadura sp. DC4]|uniref:hypothetical protein n=1 Tax=Actinomadura sp. DC4 TaxID=3055069 RepID=UPI0025B26BB1|nr:hypothetical protein [Actinomadura sp. DC4]MDN3354683.1 hypothetical protein [Actinomadura sp. DC4]